MKKSLLLGITGVTLIALTATTLYAQTVTGTSLVDKMKAVAHTFTLSADLNPGQTGFESAPVAGKKTGNMLTAGEWNRVLELLGQGGGNSGGSGEMILSEMSPTTYVNLIDAVNYCRNLTEQGMTNWKFPTYGDLVNFISSTYSGDFLWVADFDTSVINSTNITKDYFASMRLSDGYWSVSTPSDGANKVRCVAQTGGGGSSAGGSVQIVEGGIIKTSAKTISNWDLITLEGSWNGGSDAAPSGGYIYKLGGQPKLSYVEASGISKDITLTTTAQNVHNLTVRLSGDSVIIDPSSTNTLAYVVWKFGGGSTNSSRMSSPIVKTKFKPTTSASVTFDIPAGSRYATAKIFGNATGYSAIGNDENHEAMEIFFDFQNGKSSGIHNFVIGVGVNWSYGYTWEDHAFGTRVVLKNGDDTLPAGYEIWANGVRPTVNVTGSQLTISGLSNDYISQTWMVTFH